MPPPVNLAFGVEDVADARDAARAEDRAQARAQAASVAKTWESLLDEKGAVRTRDDIGLQGLTTSGSSASSGAPRPRPAGASASASSSSAPAAAAATAPDGSVPRRAMVRYVVLLLDMTDAARQPDYKPRRLEFEVEAAGRFARKFLAENPLAELALAVLRDGTCEVAAPLCTNSEEFEERLLKAAADGPRGRMSIASGLLRAKAVLEDLPPYGAREVLMLFASLSNWDPVESPVEGVIAPLQEKKVRVSVVSMSPELHVLRHISTQTGGSLSVALDAGHFEELLFSHVPAPMCGPRSLAPKLIRMGFPRQVFEVAGPAACSCHLRLHSRLYMCPQCHSRVCKVPSRCQCCDLPLVSAPVIARSFRQLRPLPAFPPLAEEAEAVRGASAAEGSRCCGCQLPGPLHSQCPDCSGRFCEACDDLMHDTLQQCPGCLEAKRRLPRP